MQATAVSPEAPLITAEAVARWLCIDRLRVYELAREGALPAVRLGRSVRFDPKRVSKFIQQGGTTGR